MNGLEERCSPSWMIQLRFESLQQQQQQPRCICRSWLELAFAWLATKLLPAAAVIVDSNFMSYFWTGKLSGLSCDPKCFLGKIQSF